MDTVEAYNIALLELMSQGNLGMVRDIYALWCYEVSWFPL
jgi:hypothetical protein